MPELELGSPRARGHALPSCAWKKAHSKVGPREDPNRMPCSGWEYPAASMTCNCKCQLDGSPAQATKQMRRQRSWFAHVCNAEADKPLFCKSARHSSHMCKGSALHARALYAQKGTVFASTLLSALCRLYPRWYPSWKKMSFLEFEHSGLFMVPKLEKSWDSSSEFELFRSAWGTRANVLALLRSTTTD